jgi:hypothetical protein
MITALPEFVRRHHNGTPLCQKSSLKIRPEIFPSGLVEAKPSDAEALRGVTQHSTAGS